MINYYPARAAQVGYKVISVGVHIYSYIYVYMFVDQESYFSDRLTFSNIHGRTFCLTYRLALSLRAPEMFSSSSKSMIF